MTGRFSNDTPGFDASVMNQLDEPNNNQQSQQHQQTDHTQTGDDNRQPSNQTDQTQSQAQTNVDDAIARTEGTQAQPNQQQQNQQRPNNQQQNNNQQQQGKKLLDDNGQEVPSNARHHFFARKNAEKQAQKLTTENATLKGQLQSFQQLHQQIAQSGLTAQEQAVAVDLGKKLKANPVEAVKEILTALKSSGINIDGAIGVSSIDTSSIAALIDSKLKPFTDMHQQQRERAEHEASIAADVNAFFDETPEAVMHAEHINVLLQKFPDWSMDKAWAQLQIAAVRNGFDLTQPLMPQYAARRGNTQNRPVNNGGHVVAMTNGRGGGVQNNHQPSTKSFGHNAQTRDIVRDAMARNGLDVSRIN